METTYLCQFDSDGKRGATYPTAGLTDEEREQYLADGYIEISEEDWAYYVGNKGAGANGTGYIRGADGKPTDAPAYVPTVEEQRQALIAQYEADKQELHNQLVDAILYDDTDTQAEIKADLATLDEEFDKAIEELEG